MRGSNERIGKDILRLPMEVRAEMAFREAVEEVIDEHARLNLPLYIWRNGKVMALSARKIRSRSKSTAKDCRKRAASTRMK